MNRIIEQPKHLTLVKPKPVLITAGVLFACGALYWLGIGPAFRWQHSSATQQEYLWRKAMTEKVYAPVIWAETREPSGLFRRMNYYYINICIDPGFDYTDLPRE